MAPPDDRIPILYVAPWVDFGGTDKGTIDWFRWIDRERFAPSLITTQPSPNRRLGEVFPLAEEVWPLPEIMAAGEMPAFVLDFIHSREIAVVHLMNSRLGFDLLPDISALPKPPRIVAQLHVEEPDRSGYVRYLTTRYGNLVDRFSVSSEHLGEAVHDYGIPRDDIRVIRTGVDPEREFDPARIEAREGLRSDRTQILYVGRLVDQKDPLLMVEVAAGLRDRGVDFQIQVLGDGQLGDLVRERVSERDLDEHVLFHPPTTRLDAWYAACDAMLMTSVFEGVPYVLYEAMAMGLPTVAPALPGNAELVPDGEGLVEPRDAVGEYVSALERLATDAEYRERRGTALREHVESRLSLRQMAEEHRELYEELAPGTTRVGESPPRPEPIVLEPRPTGGTPLVSVVVPHFNQARFLGGCIESIRAQTYPEVELIVVDDASSEDDARAALDGLEGDGDVQVVRLAENGGPSRARNAGLDRCSGRYVLPVDADNLLLGDAVENLVAQLREAPPEVGFVYPNLQYFGNREDYFEPPPFNVYALLQANYCDTCSLIDRNVFEAGERYREEIYLGHEDWEFVLRLASRGIRGEPARVPTVRYRKWGFNRSDAVGHAGEEFGEVLAEISPFKGRESEIKANEDPSLSVLPLRLLGGPGDGELGEVARGLGAQRCADAEMVAGAGGEIPDGPGDSVPPIRRIELGAGEEGTVAHLERALAASRGDLVAVCAGSGRELLADGAFVEKVLRRFQSGSGPDAIALVGAEGDERFSCVETPFPLQVVSCEKVAREPRAHTLVWKRDSERRLPRGLHVDPADPVASLARFLSGAGLWIEWRHAPGEASFPPGAGSPGWVGVATEDRNGAGEIGSDPRLTYGPLLPGAGEYRVPRWRDHPEWVPPLSKIASRYWEPTEDRRIVTSGPPPPGFEQEHHLGALRATSLEGTRRLLRDGDDYRTTERGRWRPTEAGEEEIGYLEAVQLPGLEIVALAAHRETGQRTLVRLPDDPLLPEVDLIEAMGCIDPYPLLPGGVPESVCPIGLLGLTKSVDYVDRRFRYAVDRVAEGEPIGELGGIAESDRGGSIPLWIVDGQVVTGDHHPPAVAPRPTRVLRWIAEPIAWRGMAPPSAQARAMLRRSVLAARREGGSGAAAPAGEPDGWLFERFLPGRMPLFAAYHPVTGDQLLTRAREDAAHLGYGEPVRLGFVHDSAPLTGNRETRRLRVPWARRSGAVPRVG